MNILYADKVNKTYKNGVQALNDCSLRVKEGEIFTLLGPNGAGKSTLINILTTFLKADSGTLTMMGKDYRKHGDELRAKIACVAQKTSLDTHLTMKENMMFQSRLYKIPKQEAVQLMNEMIEKFKLQKYSNYPVSSYSGGVRRRLDIALNLMSKPKLLFLDEPTVGMDIQSRSAMWEMIQKIRNDYHTTIFMTTHYLEEADLLSDTICIMNEGRNIIQGTPDELKGIIRKQLIRIDFNSSKDAKACTSFIGKYFESTVNKYSVLVNVHCIKEDMQFITKYLLEQHISFKGINIVQPTLEDVFLNFLNEKEVQS